MKKLLITAVVLTILSQQRAAASENSGLQIKQFLVPSIVNTTITGFTVHQSGQNMLLNWEADSNKMVSSFEIQRSEDGTSFQAIASISRHSSSKYNFIDNRMAGITGKAVYYRIRLISITGKENYSATVSCVFETDLSVKLYCNPAAGMLYVKVFLVKADRIFVTVRDNYGKKIRLIQQDCQAGISTLQVNVTGLSRGLYFTEVRGVQLHHIDAFMVK